MSIEQSAAQFRLGKATYDAYPENSLESWGVFGAHPDFRDGWRSAQREGEIEEHLAEQEANKPKG